MRIGVDIDGTVYPWTKAVNEALMARFAIGDPGEHQSWDFLQESITKEQWEWIWSTKAAEIVFGRMDLVYPGAVEAVNLLCSEHEVHFVTHRHPWRTAEYTGRWLNYHFRNYCGVHTVHNRCRKVSLGTWDVFIDDKDVTLAEFATQTDALVLAPARPWNEHMKYYRITRFGSWDEVPELITNHTKEEAA